MMPLQLLSHNPRIMPKDLQLPTFRDNFCLKTYHSFEEFGSQSTLLWWSEEAAEVIGFLSLAQLPHEFSYSLCRKK